MMNFKVELLVQTQQGESSKDICLAIERALLQFNKSDQPELIMVRITVHNGVSVDI